MESHAWAARSLISALLLGASSFKSGAWGSSEQATVNKLEVKTKNNAQIENGRLIAVTFKRFKIKVTDAVNLHHFNERTKPMQLFNI